MMLIFSVLIGMAFDLAGGKPAVTYYATKYDHIDVEAILNNRRMVNYYSACLLSTGPCPPEGVELKRILPEALQTNCGRCTEKQATVAFRAIKRLRKEYPKLWEQLSEMWDPNDIFVKKFETTFPSRGSIPTPSKTLTPSKTAQPPPIINRFGSGDDQPYTENAIEGTTTTSVQRNPSQHSLLDTTTQTFIISTNRTITKTSTISTSTKTDFPYEQSTPSSATTSRTTRLPPIPGLIPINTFFTNPPIPIRPIVNLNIGANIEATVKAIKEAEKLVANMALEKLGMIRSMFMRPWRRTRRKHHCVICAL